MKLRHLPSLCAALLALCPTLATAQTSAVPGFISYQGRVVDASGNNVGTGTPVNRTVIFRIWDSPSSTNTANLIYSEAQTVTVSEGEFSVLVGQGVANPTQTFGYSETDKKLADLGTAFNGSARYLGVTVAAAATIATTDNEITPRQQIVSTAFAMRAKFAESIGSSSDLTINPLSGTASNYGLGWYGTGRLFGTTAVDGPVLYGNAGGALGSNASDTRNIALRWDANGRVGIGATSITSTTNKLTLQGDMTTSPADQLTIRGNTDSNKRLLLGYDTTGNRASLQSYTASSTAGPLLLNPSGGSIGVGTGTTAPVARLTVEGSISATGSGGYTFGTGGDNDGGMFSPADGTLSFRTNSTERLRISSTGTIGTTGTIEMGNDQNISGYNTATSAQEPCFWPRSGNGTFLNYGSAGFNIRNSSNSLKMFINNDGKVGIGTSSPTNFLSVDAGSSTATASTSTAIAHVGTGDVATYFGTFDGTGGYGPWLQAGRASDATTFPLFLNPNGGRVGIGSKKAYNQLHLFGANGTSAPAHQNSASIYLQDSNSTSGSGGALLFGAMSTNATDNGGMFAGIKAHSTNVTGSQTVGDLAFYTRRAGTDSSPSESMRIMASGRVGIGTTSPRCPLEITGLTSITYTGDDYSTGSGWINKSQPGSETQNVSIYSSNWVACLAIQVFSDQRVKSDIHLTDNKSDLQTLMGIEISDYKYKDGRKFGAKPQKKVIAQQVEKVYPQAVAASTDVVPDIFKKATAKAGWVNLATDLKVGERVKLINDTEQSVHEVLEVRDGAFRTEYQVDTEKLFVYGREVKDFRTVDYDAIAMLNVSATQQIKKEKDMELKVLKEQNAGLQLKLEALEARDKIREAKQVAQQAEQIAKLAALEAKLAEQEKRATAQADADAALDARIIALQKLINKSRAPETVSIKLGDQ